MTLPDPTQQQSSEEQRRARELSLKRTHPPTDVPGVRVDRFLGSGAFGEVWSGLDMNTGRRVAVKFYLHRGGVDWGLLTREVKHLVSLSADRYIVQVLAVGWDADPPYYVMEYVENGSLEDLLQGNERLTPADAERLFHEIAIGLLHSHGKGVLHCDLKPANVLLDQDRRPRLADFGQSRLSDEQTPALGTLFYMAPEQADTEALPDARWDVYALGAILYRMLTGQAPHRNRPEATEIERSTNLHERLKRYRRLIENSPPPSEHTRVRGVDRSLAEIVDRCLAANPKRRYANVQETIDALRARTAARGRRPLVMLGIVGPLLMLLVMAVFGWRGYLEATRQSTDAIQRRAYESNAFAAKFVANALEAEIERYFAIAERESLVVELERQLLAASARPLAERLRGDDLSADERAELRNQFIDDASRVEIDAYLRGCLDKHAASLARDATMPKFASMFVTDDSGMIVGAVYEDEAVSTKSVGGNYAWRTYFHGGPEDLDRSARVPQVRPIDSAHLSAVFQSTTTRLWKVAVSTPVRASDDGRFLGVLVITVNVGDFAVLRNDNGETDRFAVVIDGRTGPTRGTILQHPLFAGQGGKADGYDFNRPEFRVREEHLKPIASAGSFSYVDPLSKAPGGEPYAGPWIAAMQPVKLPGANRFGDAPHSVDSEDVRVSEKFGDDVKRGDDSATRTSDLIVLVQENQREATRPVRTLGTRLVREGLLALTAVVCGVLALWYFVVHSPSSAVPSAGFSSSATSTPRPSASPAANASPALHDLTTLPSRNANSD